MKVSEVMSKAVVVDEDITLRQVAKIMSKKNIANVIVIKDGQINGYVSERDVLVNLSNLDKPLKNYMSKEVISISADSNISEAGKIMVERKVKRLPVIKNGKLVGAISFRDVIKNLEKEKGNEENPEENFFFN